MFRLKPKKGELERKISTEELKTLVLEGGHFIQHKHQSMLLNLFDLETITVDDVIVLRSQIEAIDLNADDDVIHTQLLTCHHTRLPIYRERMDNIVGIVHVRKVLNQMQGGKITAATLEKVVVLLILFLQEHRYFHNYNYFRRTRNESWFWWSMNMVSGWDWLHWKIL